MQGGIPVLKMNFDLDIRAKRAKTLYKLLLLFPNPRPRRVFDLVRSHVYANTWHVLGQMVKEFFICYPRVWLAAMSSIQPVHGTYPWREVIEARVYTRWYHGQFVNDLIKYNTSFTETHKNHLEIKRGVFFFHWNVQSCMDWKVLIKKAG